MILSRHSAATMDKRCRMKGVAGAAMAIVRPDHRSHLALSVEDRDDDTGGDIHLFKASSECESARITISL
jgi:hypothetical protein